MIFLISGIGDTEIEHVYHHPKVKGLNPAISTDTERKLQ